GARHQNVIGPARMPHADMAKTVHHALRVEDAVGGDEIVDQRREIAGGLRRRRRGACDQKRRNGNRAGAAVTHGAQNPFTACCVCSTSGGCAKQWPTSLRHSWKSAEPRKSTVWFSTVSHCTNRR